MENLKACNIEKITLNGKNVKRFEVRELKANALGGEDWHYVGSYTAPAKTSNKNLLDYVNNN